MKTKILTFAFFLLFASILFAQDKKLQITYPNGGVKYAHPLKRSKVIKPKIQTNFHHECLTIPNKNIPPDPAEQGYVKLFQPIHNPPCKETVHKGKNFEGNNMSGGYNNSRAPADNNLAISNSGKIVSVDNFSIMEFDIAGNEISNTEWQNFYTDTTLVYNQFFDPKVIYDSYVNRFILATLYHNQDYSDSRVLVSFSNQIIDSIPLTWNHYDFKAENFFTNTTNNKYWFDYPNIGINKDELFITLNVFNYPNRRFQKPLVLQIKKIDGYNNVQNLSYNNYTQIFSGSNYAYSLLPLSDGLQSDNYTDVMYFVNNRGRGSSEMWWRKLTGSILDGNSQISTQHYFTSPIFYNVASYASQKGGNPEDRIRLVDNRLLSGFYKDSILHFVFHSSDHGWMQIVYETFDLHNNSITAYTHGGLEDLTNYLYPSITCMNTENNPNDKVIINYNRTSPDIYIQLDAIDFQNGKWGCDRVIKLGQGLLNLRTYDGTSDTYERLGDYTSIQRKYDSNKAWLVGSYPFGNGPNDNGATNGLNAWISEVNLVGFWGNQTSLNYTMFPNPNNTNELHFNFSNNSKLQQKNIIIKDVTGFKVFEVNTKNNTINLPYLKKGIYFVKIITKNHHYESKKLIIN